MVRQNRKSGDVSEAAFVAAVTVSAASVTGSPVLSVFLHSDGLQLHAPPTPPPPAPVPVSPVWSQVVFSVVTSLQSSCLGLRAGSWSEARRDPQNNADL